MNKITLTVGGIVAAGATAVIFASPASAWDEEECQRWYEKYGTVHEHCEPPETTAPPTTTPETTTTSTTAPPVQTTTTTTVRIDTEPVEVIEVAPPATPIVTPRIEFTG